MAISKDAMQKMILNTVSSVAKIKLDSYDANLLDSALDIHPADFLYIIEEIEEKLGREIVDIFKLHDSNVMTVSFMAEAILELDRNI